MVAARGVSGAAISAASWFTAPRPSSMIGTRIVVSAGRANAASGISSNPATAMWPGTARPSAPNAARHPIAITSLAANTAAGRGVLAASSRPAAYPEVSVKSPRITTGRADGSAAASSSR